ncbi:Sorting nexin-41 [Spathaspora sp. JA1]|nr:Sorting nexin-41 [Spathaspora sp. JA1]
MEPVNDSEQLDQTVSKTQSPQADQQPPPAQHSFIEDEEDNNPFSHQGLGSLISHPSNGKTTVEPDELVDLDEEGDESLLLYNSNLATATSATTSNGKKPQETFNTVQMNFESRVTKLLKPNIKVRAQIIEAGNSNEGMANASKKYVVYTIKLINVEGGSHGDEILTRRRYSDFESLRDVLTKVFPLIVIPPIPPKNYFNFSVWNGLVGTSSSNGINSSNGIITTTTVDSSGNVTSGGSNPPATTTGSNGNKGLPTYSYINSTHLTKNKLIEHRKRLLTNFLNNCLDIRQIRHLEFFAKFLDPNANWSDEIALITSQLPKSIYLSNPENGLKTDPVYAHLPNPTNKNTMSFFKDNRKKLTKKTNRLLSNDESQQAEQQPEGDDKDSTSPGPSSNSQHIVSTSMLDDINKRIMANFIGLSNDYTELGTIFNSFSVILGDFPGKSKQDDVKLNIIFDKIGQSFDRSYITINSLIGELETKFSEPLGEVVQYTTILQYISKYQSRKFKQKQLLDTDVIEKKRDLSELLRMEEESSRIENAINSQGISRNTKFNLESATSKKSTSSVKPQDSQASTSKFRFPSFKKITQYVSEIIDQNPQQTRKQKITQLQDKIKVLERCQDIMLADLSFITDEVNKNIQAFHTRQLKMIYEILLCYNRFLIGWAKKNIDIWEEVKEEIIKL